MHGTKLFRAAGGWWRMRRLSRRRAADLLLWLAITGPVFITDELPDAQTPVGLPLWWVMIAAVPLLGLAVAAGRRWPVPAAAVPAGLGLAATPELYTINFVIAQVALAFLLGRRTAGTRTGPVFFGGVCLAGVTVVALSPAGTRWSWSTIVATAMMTIMLPWLAGRYVRQRHELVRTGWNLAERLEQEHDLIGERARLVERARIAGDMHDSLGHELSLIALRAAALQVRPGLAEPARAAARELRESAAAATDRLREIVEVLRQDGEPAPVSPPGDTIDALAERAAAAGMAVTVAGELPPLPPMTDRAAYRVVQEALTNATKHAPGAAVTVCQDVDAAGQVVVTVTNEPPPAGPPPGARSGGYGLISLDERVRLAGGRLRARPAAGGFAVIARLPLAAGAAPNPPDSQRQFALARRRARRTVLDAIWIPVAAAAALLGLVFGLHFYYAYRSLLDAGLYEELRVGQSRSTVERRLPAYQAGDEGLSGAPADPPGTDECRFYRTTVFSIEVYSAYRMCFTGGRLSHKDKVEITYR